MHAEGSPKAERLPVARRPSARLPRVAVSVLFIRFLMIGYSVAAVGASVCVWMVVLMDPASAAGWAAMVCIPLIAAGLLVRPMATHDLRLLAVERYGMAFIALGSCVALAAALVYAGMAAL